MFVACCTGVLYSLPGFFCLFLVYSLFGLLDDFRWENVQAKPTDSSAWWRRAKVTHNGDISVRSRKLTWWIFTLDLEGEANFLRQTKDVSFRVATAWDITQGRYQNKKKVNIMDGVDGRVHWNVNYDLPEFSGHFSSHENDTVNDMHASLGYAHAEISKVELSVWPRNLTFPKSRRALIEGEKKADSEGDASPWGIDSFTSMFTKRS